MIRIFAFLLLFISSVSAQIRPGQLWPDTDGQHINAHGGGVLFHKGQYYWYGEIKGKNSLAEVGVSVYSSKDLKTWNNEGIALKVSDDPNSDITKGCVMERPKVIYNAKTKKFVMWFHLELKGQGYAAARTGLAVSDSPVGPFVFQKSLRPNAGKWPLNFEEEWKKPRAGEDTLKWWTPNWYTAVKEGLFIRKHIEGGQMARDMTLYVDQKGKAFHVYSSEENLTLHIAELNDTYTDFTGRYITVAPAGHNEAPALFYQDGWYYMITSGCTGWDPNAARSFRAKDMLGPWEELGNPCVGEGAELTFKSQGTFILPVQGKKNAFIFMADRWNPKNHIDGRYIWLPIQMEGGKPKIYWKDEWDLEVFDKKR